LLNLQKDFSCDSDPEHLEAVPVSMLPREKRLFDMREKRPIPVASNPKPVDKQEHDRLTNSREKPIIDSSEIYFTEDFGSQGFTRNQDEDEQRESYVEFKESLIPGYLGSEATYQVQMSSNAIHSSPRDTTDNFSVDQKDKYLLDDNQLKLVHCFQQAVFNNRSDINKSVDGIIEEFTESRVSHFGQPAVAKHLEVFEDIDVVPGVSLARVILDCLKRLEAIRATPVKRSDFQQYGENHLQMVYRSFFRASCKIRHQLAAAVTKYILHRCNYLGGASRLRFNEQHQRERAMETKCEDPRLLEHIRILRRFKYNDWWKKNQLAPEKHGKLKDNKKGQLPFVINMITE